MESLSFEEVLKKGDSVTIVDLKEENWKHKLFAILNPPFNAGYRGQKSFLCLLDLVRNKLNAHTAIVGKYISTDWNEEYASIYSRIFYDVPRYTQRIHFFSRPISYNDLYKISDVKKKAYLGYTVMRPLESFRVGDSILASPCTVLPQRRNLVHCLEKFDVSLLGNSLQVIGTPFLQQETTAAVCAEADLWMVARYLNKKGLTRRYRPAEITEIANRSITTGQARAGLHELQMMYVLRQMGLTPLLHHPYDAKEAKQFIYTCVESQLPVIAGIPGHVFVIIGHDYKKHMKFGNGISSSSLAVNSFIVHDDASGPYREMRIDKVVRKLGKDSSGKERKIELLTLDGNEVDFLLVTVHPRIHMHLTDVEEHTVEWLSSVRQNVSEIWKKDCKELWARGDFDNLVTRTYLRLSGDFKHDITYQKENWTPRNKRIIAEYKCMEMPKYIWVIELATPSDLNKTSLYERKIRGEIIFDSTGNRWAPNETLLAFHFDGKMFIPRRKGKPHNFISEKEPSYSPLQRSIHQG